MLLKLNGDIRKKITNQDAVSWKNIKSILYDHFSHLCNTNLITTQSENLKQGKIESIADYAERARRLLNKKNAMYSNLSEKQKTEHNRIAHKAFTRGLTNLEIKDKTVGIYTYQRYNF